MQYERKKYCHKGLKNSKVIMEKYKRIRRNKI